MVFLYFTVVSVQNYMRAGEELAQAQKEYDIAPAESKVAQEEYSNVGKYGCAYPTVGQGYVMCP